MRGTTIVAVAAVTAAFSTTWLRQARADVTYKFESGPNVLASITFASPPASATMGWMLPVSTPPYLVTGVMGVADYNTFASSPVVSIGTSEVDSAITSLNGSHLDAGSVATSLMTLFATGPPGSIYIQDEEFIFGPNGAGSIEYFCGTVGGRGSTDFFQEGVWVQGVVMPEPTSLMMLSLGLAAVAGVAWRHRKAKLAG
jgi:hypothetical protein